MTNPCRVSVEERNHDLTQYGAEDENKRVDAIAFDAARELITDKKQFNSLVHDYELDVGEMARAFRELDNATLGNQTSIEACLNALSNMQKVYLFKAFKLCRDEAERRVRDEAQRR